MALLTAAAFILVSAATLLGAGSDAWPLRMFLRKTTEDEDAAAHGVEWSLLFLFLALALGITVVSARYLIYQQANVRSAARAQLEAIADLKVQQIVNWRKERLGDANLVFNTPWVSSRLREFLAAPSRNQAGQEIVGWLKVLRQSYGYDRITVLDPQLNARLSMPSVTEPIAAAVRSTVREALERRQVVFTDLYRATESGDIRLDLVVPLLVRGLPGANTGAQPVFPPVPGEPPVGVLLLRVNPQTFFYPLIQTWPTASPTAETLLVRREGQEVVYLNELRHQKGTAMSLRRSLDEARLPAAIGLRGERGVREGVDYRGARVVVAARAVPDTAWLMVAKVDEAELYAPLRREAFRVGMMALGLQLAAALGVTLLWRRRNEQFLRARLSDEHDRRALAERFEHLMKSAGDTILLADDQNRILEANDRALAFYGYSFSELRAMSLPELRPIEAQGDFIRQTKDLVSTGYAAFEALHRRKDGSVFPVEVSCRIVEIGGTRYTLDIVRDITQRKAQEEALDHERNLLRTLMDNLPDYIYVKDAGGAVPPGQPRGGAEPGPDLAGGNRGPDRR